MIGVDKLLHFLCCLAIVLGVCGMVSITSDFNTALIAGVWAATGAAAGKEYGDSQAKNNYWSWGDILADVLGIITGVGVLLLIKLLINV